MCRSLLAAPSIKPLPIPMSWKSWPLRQGPKGFSTQGKLSLSGLAPRRPSRDSSSGDVVSSFPASCGGHVRIMQPCCKPSNAPYRHPQPVHPRSFHFWQLLDASDAKWPVETDLGPPVALCTSSAGNQLHLAESMACCKSLWLPGVPVNEMSFCLSKH